MTAANTKKRSRSETRLMAVLGRGPLTEIQDLRFSEFPMLLRAGDLLVVNDAATLPASFSGTHARTARPIEMRLAAARSENAQELSRWLAIFFGAGNWRTRTELRPLPPALKIGDTLDLHNGTLKARVTALRSDRMAEIEFLGNKSDLWGPLYAAGHPVQYSHLLEDLELWDVQTVFASGPPVSLEAPSAAFPFDWETVFALERRGVKIAPLTHAAGLSTLGTPELDRILPLPERYWIPESTADAVNHARREDRRVIAVGTTVVRALESAAQGDGKSTSTVRAGSGLATLHIHPGFKRRAVNGILSGFHDTGASHLELLGSFVAPQKLASAYGEAEARGYLAHEFGDSCLMIHSE